MLGEPGGDFPQAPEHDTYRQLLEQRRPLPAQRWDNLIATYNVTKRLPLEGPAKRLIDLERERGLDV